MAEPTHLEKLTAQVKELVKSGMKELSQVERAELNPELSSTELSQALAKVRAQANRLSGLMEQVLTLEMRVGAAHRKAVWALKLKQDQSCLEESVVGQKRKEERDAALALLCVPEEQARFELSELDQVLADFHKVVFESCENLRRTSHEIRSQIDLFRAQVTIGEGTQFVTGGTEGPVDIG